MNNLIKSKLKQFDELYDNIPLTKREYNRWRTKVIRLGELIWFHFDRNDLWDSFDDILEFKKRYSPYYIKHHLKTLHKVDYNPE
jgi:hypothetical protein